MTAAEFREVLAALGMTQRGFASFSGANHRTVERWVAGDSDIPAWVPVMLGLLRSVPTVPGYWQNETSGVLVPVVQAYLRHEFLTPEQCAAMRAYLRQWMASPAWAGPELARLRERIDSLDSTPAITSWLRDALESGIDPL